MTTPVSEFIVSTPNGAVQSVSVTAQTFSVNGGTLVLCSQNGQTVAAFASGAWSQVLPVAST